jgi:hypothetical protein
VPDWLPGVLSATGAEPRINLVRGSCWHTYGANASDLSANVPVEDCRLPPDRLDALFDAVNRSVARSIPPSLSTSAALEVLRRNVQILTGRAACPGGCRAGLQSLVLYPEGDVALCEMLRPFGNIAAHGYDVPALWRSAGARTAAVSKSCACTHECRWFTSLPYDGRLLAGVLLRYRRALRARAERASGDRREP